MPATRTLVITNKRGLHAREPDAHLLQSAQAAPGLGQLVLAFKGCLRHLRVGWFYPAYNLC